MSLIRLYGTEYNVRSVLSFSDHGRDRKNSYVNATKNDCTILVVVGSTIFLGVHWDHHDHEAHHLAKANDHHSIDLI